MASPCLATWPLEDPNAEDRATGARHHCGAPIGHQGPHRCVCGAFPPDPFNAALADAIEETP